MSLKNDILKAREILSKKKLPISKKDMPKIRIDLPAMGKYLRQTGKSFDELSEDEVQKFAI